VEIGNKRAAICAATFIAVLGSSTSVSAQVRQFDVPSEDAGKSIPEFARQAHIQVVAPGDQLHGVTTPPLKGTYGVFAALDLMLKGTGLKVSHSAEGIVTISQLETEKGEEREEMPSTLKNSTSIWALILGVFAGSTAHAQSADVQSASAGEVEQVTVSGIRGSLNAARDIKRDATQIVDTIVADDIGKLPDTNVAESLGRVSGVQVARGIGEGSTVSIRGLTQNVFLLNGRQIDDATGRGGNGLDPLGTTSFGLLTLVPSELIQRLDVTKLAGSDQIAGALGGIVDIRTRMPLDGPDQAAAKIGGIDSDQSQRQGYQAFVLGSHAFANDTLGILLSATYTNEPVSQQGLDTFSGYVKYNDASGTSRFGDSDFRAEEISQTSKTLGLDGTIQWRPTSAFELTADTFYSSFSTLRDRWFVSIIPTAGLSNATYSGNNVLLSGTAKSPLISNTEILPIYSTIWSSALRGRYDISDRLKTTAEISYDRSADNEHQITLKLQSAATPVNFDLTSGALGSFQYSGVDLTDPSQLSAVGSLDNRQFALTRDFAMRNDWSYDLGDGLLKTISAGLRYDQANSNKINSSVSASLGTGVPAASLSKYLTVHSNPDFAAGDFAGVPRAYLVANNNLTGCGVVTDVPAISQSAQCLNPFNNPTSLAGTYTIKEHFTEGYAKLDFDTLIGSMALSGNVGVRYIRRGEVSIGNLISGSGTITPNTFTRTDQDWLPSAVAKLAVTDDLIVRAGAAQVVAFPNTADLNNGVSLNQSALFVNGVQTQLGGGSGGAPNLNPFKANQFDVSTEYYFAESALVSVGLFYKDISTFVVPTQVLENYSGTNYLVSRKVNGAGARVQGVEVLGQLPFYFLPDPFDGFGLLATYSYIDSSTPSTDSTGRALPFPGLSRNNVNLVGYYEKGPYSVRVAYNWRDDYLLSLSNAQTGIFNGSYTDMSATLRYDLTDNLSLGFEAQNLLDEKQRSYDGFQEALRTNVFYGRVFKATISAKF